VTTSTNESTDVAAPVGHRPTFDYVSPDQLRFDPDNPRFGGLVKNMSEGDIQTHLEGSPHNALELVESFLQNGFIDYEPLVVKREGVDEQERSTYKVIEGNRRLAAIRHILATPMLFETEAIKDLHSIPVLIFPELDDLAGLTEMRVYLGVRHLLGFRGWPPLSKAAFLDKFIKSQDDLKHAIQELGVTKSELRRYLVPYRIIAKDKGSRELRKDETFWTFAEALARSGIKEYIALEVNPDTLQVSSFDPKRLANLRTFLYGDKTREAAVRETRQLSSLAKVLGSAKASDKLEKGATLEEAELFVEQKSRMLKKLAAALETTLKRIFKLRPNAEDAKLLIDLIEPFLKRLRS
jgi:hypothetical protein